MASMPVAPNPKEKKNTLMLLNNGKIVYRLEIDGYPENDDSGDDDETVMDYWRKEHFRKSNHTFYGDDD